MLPELQAHIDKMYRFTQLPAIRPLAEVDRWTVSDNEKRPIDLFALFSRGVVRGCSKNASRTHLIAGSTMTLDNLAKELPDAANFAYMLDSQRDHVCILDIEPECDEALKQELIKTPYLYAETSLSGKGYHLLLPVPTDILAKYPNAAQSSVIKNKADGYEILFEHWVTFTGNQITPETNDGSFFYKLFDKLCSQQKHIHVNNIDVASERPTIPHAEELYEALSASVIPPHITPEKYDNDLSRYEFAAGCYLLNRIRIAQTKIETLEHAGEPIWDDSQTAWVLYDKLAETLEYRDKHDSLRVGMPWLLYQATKIIGATYEPPSTEEV